MKKLKKIAQGRARREERQQDAKERNAYTAKLSLKDRIDVVLRRPGESRRELAKLNERLTAEQPMDGVAFKKIHDKKTEKKTTKTAA